MSEINLDDCTCAICLDILIEPLKTPCDHEICFKCFLAFYHDQKVFQCHICREKCPDWATEVFLKGKAMVNAPRWNDIRQIFDKEVENKLNGLSAKLICEEMQIFENEKVVGHVLAEPGELRAEYLEFVRREEEELRVRREEEERASLEFIKRFCDKEDTSTTKRQRLGSNTDNTPILLNELALDFSGFPVYNHGDEDEDTGDEDEDTSEVDDDIGEDTSDEDEDTGEEEDEDTGDDKDEDTGDDKDEDTGDDKDEDTGDEGTGEED